MPYPSPSVGGHFLQSGIDYLPMRSGVRIFIFGKSFRDGWAGQAAVDAPLADEASFVFSWPKRL